MSYFSNARQSQSARLGDCTKPHPAGHLRRRKFIKLLGGAVTVWCMQSEE